MNVDFKSHTDLRMLKRIVEHEVKKGWKKAGDVYVDAHEITYVVEVPKIHVTPIYYQKLIKEDTIP